MGFEEMKKIWDTQNNEPLYVLNENALHDQIRLKKRKAGHITNVSELATIGVNIFASLFVMGVNIVNGITNIYMYLLVLWMAITAIGVSIGRFRRLRGQGKFDRSILGDLDFAIATATYQVSLSSILRWNIIPMGIFIFLGILDIGKPIGTGIALVVFLAMTYFASAWEHNYYKARRREVQSLRNLLLSEAGNVQ